VVSDSAIIDYPYIPKELLTRMLVDQQKVIEKIMNLECTIIPIKLGTFVENENEILNILSKGYPVIKDVFNKIFNKIEVEVTALWNDFNSVIKDSGKDKEIKEFKESLLTKPEGVTLNDNIQIGFMIKKYIDRTKEEYINEIQTSLSQVAQAIKIHEIITEEIVVNMSFLIDKNSQKDFESILESLNTKLGKILKFKYVGPLPPYSFYILEIKKMQLKEIELAKGKLGLSHFISINKDEIKKAYQKLVFTCHPDQNTGSPDMEKEFEELTKAYKLLVDYYDIDRQDSYAFNNNDLNNELRNNTILVKV